MIRTSFAGLSFAMVAGFVCVHISVAQEAERPSASEAVEQSPKTHTLRRQPFVARVELSGVLESTEMHEVRLVPEQWASWTVDRAVAHGAKVRKGEPIIWFDVRGLDQKIDDLEAGRDLTKHELKQAQEELALLERSVPIDLAKARRTAKIAAEDLARFTKIQQPASLRNSAFLLESAENYLAYEREELKQLERMYQADDLTDETEEIILRRARDSVKRAENSLLRAKEKNKETVAVELPREQQSRQEAVDAAKLGLASAEVDLPLKLSKAKLAIEKLKYDHNKADAELTRLKRDWKKLTIYAPAKGLVYYGRCEDGKWPGAATVAKMLRPGGSVSPHAVLLTIVNPEKLIVRAEVPQQKLGSLRPGQQGLVTVAGFETSLVPCVMKSVAKLPDPNGKNSCVLEPSRPYPYTLIKRLPDPGLLPGMNCRVDLHVRRPNVWLVPKDAINGATGWPGVRYVSVLDADGKIQKRMVVVVGQSEDEDQVDILRGLSVSDWAQLTGKKDILRQRSQYELNDGDKLLLEEPTE